MTEKAIFAAGCFWGVEERFRKLDGVLKTKVGYIGGKTENPTYEEVCSKRTGHAEAVEIEFDNEIIKYKDLLKTFFSIHDPTTKNRQGFDIGDQYRSEIFYTTEEQKKEAEEYKKELSENERYKITPIVTEVTEAPTFYDAEEYHQKYIMKKEGNA